MGQMNWRCILNGNDNGMNFHEAVEAYNSLFDLEKYPITKDMIFEFFSNKPDIYQRTHGTFRSNCWEFRAFGRIYCAEDEVGDNIRWIARDLNKDKIIIIGEIHGWWEKGETQ